MASLICPVCGTENPSNRQFCRKCASDLRAPIANPNAPVAPPPTPVPVRPIVIGGGIALVAVVLILGLLVALGGSPAPSPAPSVTLAPATGSPAPLATASAQPSAAPTVAPTAATEPTEQPAPLIRSFEGPVSVDCNDPAFNGFIHLSWRVGFADGATLSIDGPGVYKSYPGVLGQDDVPFGCGGEPHTYTLTTVGGNGPAATKTLQISQPG
ncbi:MAG TPA: zinc-ribbon domain-containing protein [Candidatus Limnocylindrales bacterium]